ncbi:hypothetical protein [Paenibacillus sp. YPG26]|uniref:hypothetical protein n=1 Tax=Paenibacillus sp. YPG26 TaxID=2878915 RepID=UPI00203A8B6F|nr:hypothetical protein [Paenibacillus sp. YPG26]USB34213.1 hypothetical protein LDO05_05285 [Paenibacillus sp. YPG26]
MKKTFYVSVQGRSVLEDPGAAAYEWVIRATSEEADELRRWLSSSVEADEDEFMGYVFPWPDTPEEGRSAAYSERISQVYQEIYRLGTTDTRSQMANANLIHA